ncbi:MAG: hypothetical protein GXO26_02535 [Crenarchaeota archaeon]|nr:hypothetical protein [Thermoproteota archaeon]
MTDAYNTSIFRELFLHRFFRIGRPRLNYGGTKSKILDNVFINVKNNILKILNNCYIHRELVLLRLNLKKSVFFVVSGSSSVKMFVPAHIVARVRNSLVEESF